jgi:hypothetical protein
MVAKSLHNDAWQDREEQARSTSASRLTIRYNFLYRIPANMDEIERTLSANLQSVC